MKNQGPTNLQAVRNGSGIPQKQQPLSPQDQLRQAIQERDSIKHQIDHRADNQVFGVLNLCSSVFVALVQKSDMQWQDAMDMSFEAVSAYRKKLETYKEVLLNEIPTPESWTRALAEVNELVSVLQANVDFIDKHEAQQSEIMGGVQQLSGSGQDGPASEGPKAS